MTWQALDRGGADAAASPADEAVQRGVTLLLAGDEDGAGAAFERALALSPDHPEATYDRAVLAWDRGELADDEVVRRVQVARERHLGAARATWLLGLALNERRAPERTRAAFAKAARLGCADEPPAPAASWSGAPTGRRPRCLRTFDFPGRAAGSVAVAQRRRRALVATSEVVHLVDLDDLSVRATLGLDDTVECTATFEGDRALGFAGGLDRTVRVIDLESGECLRVLEGHRRGVTCLAPSADGRRLLTGCNDGRLRVFDVASGACTATFGGADVGVIKAIAWSGDDVVSGGADGVLRFWAPGSTERASVARGHEGAVTGLGAFDGALASASLDGTVRVWGPGGATLAVHRLGVAVTCFALAPAGKQALLGTSDGSVRLLDLERGSYLAALPLHEGATSAVAIAPDASFGLSTGEDAKLRVIELARATAAPPLVLPRAARAPSRADEVRPPAASTAAPVAGSTPVLADDWNDRGVASFEAGEEEAARRAWAAALEAEPHHAEATYNLAVHAWERGEVRDDEVLRRLAHARRGPRPSLQAAELTHLVHLARGGAAPAIAGAALEAPRCLRTIELAPGRGVSAVALAGDGRLAFSAGPDGVQVHDLATGVTRAFEGIVPPQDAQATLERRLDLVSGERLAERRTVCVSPADSRRALSAEGATVRLWDLEDGECLRTWSFARRVSQVAWTPDGARAVAGGEDQVLRILDLERGAEGHAADAGGAICALAVSADGRSCVVGCEPDLHDDRVARAATPSLQRWELGPRARTFRPVRARPRGVSDDERHGRDVALHLGAARAALVARDAAAVHAALTAARAVPGHAEDQGVRELTLSAARQLDRTLVGPRAVWPLRTLPLEDARYLALGTGSTAFALADAPDHVQARLLHVVDLATGRTERSFTLPSSPGMASGGGRALVGVASSQLFDLTATGALAELEGGPVAISPQGRFALVAERGRFAVWDLDERRCLSRFDPRSRNFGSAALSPDGRLVLLGSGFDVALHVFDATTGRRLHELPAYGWGVGQVRISLDGRFAVTGGAGVRVGGRAPEGRGYPDDGFGLRVLDLATGRWTRSLPDDGEGRGGGLTFELSHCGRWALATARGGLRLIDLAEGTETQVVDLARGPRSLAWNGRYAVTAAIGEDGLRVFEFDWDFDPRARGDR